MIIASLDEDLISNSKTKAEVWDRIINADLIEKEAIVMLFVSLNIQEKPDLCFELFRKYPSYSILSDVWDHYLSITNKIERNIIWKHYINILNSEDQASKK